MKVIAICSVIIPNTPQTRRGLNLRSDLPLTTNASPICEKIKTLKTTVRARVSDFPKFIIK